MYEISAHTKNSFRIFFEWTLKRGLQNRTLNKMFWFWISRFEFEKKSNNLTLPLKQTGYEEN